MTGAEIAAIVGAILGSAGIGGAVVAWINREPTIADKYRELLEYMERREARLEERMAESLAERGTLSAEIQLLQGRVRDLEELRRENARLHAENEGLRRQVAELRARVEQLEREQQSRPPTR